MEINWSVSLEHEEYADDLELVVKDAIDAVQQTSIGFYVNVVTPETLGNPNDYLSDALILFFVKKLKPSILINVVAEVMCCGYGEKNKCFQ